MDHVGIHGCIVVGDHIPHLVNRRRAYQHQVARMIVGFHADAIHQNIRYLAAQFEGGKGDPNNSQAGS